jgi:leader peptidase (prepilin peptidase)/N-methyltransferase
MDHRRSRCRRDRRPADTRQRVFRSTESGQPPRPACPASGQKILPDRWRWRALLPVTGRCSRCHARIGPYLLLAVPLAFIDAAVRRLPDPLTAAAFAGTLALLAVTALTGHQPGHLGRAAIGAVALTSFYLVLAVIRPGGLGLGDAKLAASTGAALGWIGWQALLSGTFAAFALAGVYGGALLALHRARRTSHLPLGPFILLGTLAAIAL